MHMFLNLVPFNLLFVLPSRPVGAISFYPMHTKTNLYVMLYIYIYIYIYLPKLSGNIILCTVILRTVDVVCCWSLPKYSTQGGPVST